MLDDYEYTFFDAGLANKFSKQCEALGVSVVTKEDKSHTGEAMFEVGLTSEVTDVQLEKIEDNYNDILFGEQAALIEGSGVGVEADACGVQVQLASGVFTTVAVHPEIMNKILSVLTIEELQRFLAQVAEDIENPKQGPICGRDDLPST